MFTEVKIERSWWSWGMRVFSVMMSRRQTNCLFCLCLCSHPNIWSLNPCDLSTDCHRCCHPPCLLLWSVSRGLFWLRRPLVIKVALDANTAMLSHRKVAQIWLEQIWFDQTVRGKKTRGHVRAGTKKNLIYWEFACWRISTQPLNMAFYVTLI